MIQSRTCKNCGGTFLGGPRTLYCNACRILRTQEIWRNYKRRKHAGVARALGGIDICERCGKTYTIESGNQRVCPDCRPIYYAECDRNKKLERLKQLNQSKQRRDYFRKRETVRREERLKAGLCPQCGGEWIEPVETHRGKPKHCRRCQDYYRNRNKKAREPKPPG